MFHRVWKFVARTKYDRNHFIQNGFDFGRQEAAWATGMDAAKDASKQETERKTHTV